MIEESLQIAIKNLSYDIEFQEAVRDGIELDSDTRNVPDLPEFSDHSQ